MGTPQLVRVVPNENWELVLEFGDSEFRLFKAAIAREEKRWPQLAYPDKFKNLTYTGDAVRWAAGEELDASYLYKNSQPLPREKLEQQVLRLSYKNQAPTPVHPTHHVYGVYLLPFRPKLFEVGESIAGGHAEMGGSRSLSLEELLRWPEWKEHFDLSGGAWAVPLIESCPAEQLQLADILILEICRRQGTVHVQSVVSTR